MNGWLPLLAALLSVSAALSVQAPMDKERIGLPLTEVMRPWTGDLRGMAERRMVRVLTAARKRFNALVALFRKYGAQYEMDWMLMAAQGYQESRLDHVARTYLLIQGEYIQRREVRKKGSED